MSYRLGRKPLNSVLHALEAKRPPKTEDLLALLGDLPEPVSEYIAMLNEGRKFRGRPKKMRVDKALDRLDAHALIAKRMRDEGVTKSAAIESLDDDNIPGSSRRSLQNKTRRK